MLAPRATESRYGGRAFCLPWLLSLSLFLHCITDAFAGDNRPDRTPTYSVPQFLLSPSVAGFTFAVFPTVAAAGTPRTIFLTDLTYCVDYSYTLNTSRLASDNLVSLERFPVSGRPSCLIFPPTAPPVSSTFEFTPANIGNSSIRFIEVLTGQDVTPSLVVKTVSAKTPSKFDVNGGWFDPGTNGSGIALHHRRTTTDAAFGTWFLFNDRGESRWITFQSARWQEDGSVLEGLLFEVSSNSPACATPAGLPAVDACPATGSVTSSGRGMLQPAILRIRFLSASRATAEASTFTGQILFTSELVKLEF